MSYIESASAFSDVQQAVFFILRNDPILQTQVNGVFDYVPNNRPYPYLQLGSFTDGGNLTMSNYGKDVNATIHVFCRNQEVQGGLQGAKQTEQIMNSVDRLLSVKMFPINHEWVNSGCFPAKNDVFLLNDGITHHGILTYTIKVFRRYPNG